jgi:thymidine kinase
MAKLYFYYSAMNAGKSTVLLQSSYNYQERGMDTLLFTPDIDARFGTRKIASRIGLAAEAISFGRDYNLFDYAATEQAKSPKLRCILVDEAQFLTKEQVHQLTDIVDQLNLPVLAYGLRSDFKGEPFEGSLYLLVLADNLLEIKTICFCGKKATMNARLDSEGKILRSGAQVQIGGNESYTAMCRKHYKGVVE